MTIQQLYEKRDFIRYYNDKAPDKQLVTDLITTTYNLVPSKQNLVPYSIDVWGPDKDKTLLMQLTTRDYHIRDLNKNPNTQLLAPYLLIFTTRLVNPNEFARVRIERGVEFACADKDLYQTQRAIKFCMIEIGMFSSILTGLCIENNIDTGYTLCLFENDSQQDMFKEKVLFIMSLGYRERNFTKQQKQQLYQSMGQTKPPINDVITYY